MNRPYTARAVRSGAWWAISIVGMKGAHSQAKRLDQVEANAREVIALMTDTDPSSFDVIVDPVLQEGASDVLADLENARRAVDEATRRAALASRRAAARLVCQDGLTVRDAGRLLGVSPQRVSQLMHNDR